MPELGSYGSVRGAVGNSRPYRKCRPHADGAARNGAWRTQTFTGGKCFPCPIRSPLFSRCRTLHRTGQHTHRRNSRSR
jgi:hypothetical protein